jgi:hypothetical protein
MTTVIVITAKRNGFRRCGVAHSDQPTTWQQDDFTDEQWEELFKEPQLFLAIYEQDTGLGLEQRNALTSSAALPEASNTAQNAQSQTFKADSPTLGDGVLLPGASDAGSLDLLWDDALLEDRARGVAKAQAAADLELDSLWEEALLEDQAHEATKTAAAKPPTKPGKAKAGKE